MNRWNFRYDKEEKGMKEMEWVGYDVKGGILFPQLYLSPRSDALSLLLLLPFPHTSSFFFTKNRNEWIVSSVSGCRKSAHNSKMKEGRNGKGHEMSSLFPWYKFQFHMSQALPLSLLTINGFWQREHYRLMNKGKKYTERTTWKIESEVNSKLLSVMRCISLTIWITRQQNKRMTVSQVDWSEFWRYNFGTVQTSESDDSSLKRFNGYWERKQRSKEENLDTRLAPCHSLLEDRNFFTRHTCLAPNRSYPHFFLNFELGFDEKMNGLREGEYFERENVRHSRMILCTN